MSVKNNQIYFIQAPNGLVKIGKSKKPSVRLKGLQTGSPVILKIKKTIGGGAFLEAILHLYFAKIRKHGEWFKPDYELKGFLMGKRKISIALIYDVVEDQLSKGKRKYLQDLEKKRLYL